MQVTIKPTGAADRSDHVTFDDPERFELTGDRQLILGDERLEDPETGELLEGNEVWNREDYEWFRVNVDDGEEE